MLLSRIELLGLILKETSEGEKEKVNNLNPYNNKEDNLNPIQNLCSYIHWYISKLKYPKKLFDNQKFSGLKAKIFTEEV